MQKVMIYCGEENKYYLRQDGPGASPVMICRFRLEISGGDRVILPAELPNYNAVVRWQADLVERGYTLEYRP
jgi:hypothetical protein